MHKFTASVRNVTDRPIDLVTLEIIYYDANGSEIGAGSDTVRHLEPGSAKDFGHNVPPDGLRGVADTTDVIPRPYVEGGAK